MLKASRALCLHVGLLLLHLCGSNGLIGSINNEVTKLKIMETVEKLKIFEENEMSTCETQYLEKISLMTEIVEEQRCHDYEFRLTCRDIESHIAILEAWYTSMKNYHAADTHQNMRLRTEDDTQLDHVYVFSSPKHDGVYSLDQSISVNSSVPVESVESVDVMVDVNDSDCSGASYARSYASWHEGDKRRPHAAWDASINLRAPLSYRCTGVNHCSFILKEDYPPSTSWSPGLVYIKYACFDDFLSVHYCNREVSAEESGPESEGYVRTPGYPNFYIGGECRWRLRAHPQQRVKVTLLDVSLRSVGPFERACADYVTVVDANGEVLLSSCEQVELPLRLVSKTNVVDVVVNAGSRGAFPKRGVLLNYKSYGCIAVSAPSNGYLVYRNNEIAHYVCNNNYVFEDTHERVRFLWCYDDNRWNDTVPPCVEELVRTVANGTESTLVVTQTDAKLTHKEDNMIVDIVIPSLLIAALFIGNAFIVLIIYKYRKRKSDEIDDEFNTIPLSANGNAHSAGNAV